MNVKNVFLNGDLRKEGYMQPPFGYAHSDHQVCFLCRGFMASSRLFWIGLKSLTYLFLNRVSSVVRITLILLYVDNMIITRDDSVGICAFQHFLSEHFKIKDLGTLRNFLGFEVTSSSSGYYLSQAKYALDLLSNVGLTNDKTISTPLEFNCKLTPLDGEPLLDVTRYCQLVGS